VPLPLGYKSMEASQLRYLIACLASYSLTRAASKWGDRWDSNPLPLGHNQPCLSINTTATAESRGIEPHTLPYVPLSKRTPSPSGIALQESQTWESNPASLRYEGRLYNQYVWHGAAEGNRTPTESVPRTRANHFHYSGMEPDKGFEPFATYLQGTLPTYRDHPACAEPLGFFLEPLVGRYFLHGPPEG
jgi:hypothetical protein